MPPSSLLPAEVGRGPNDPLGVIIAAVAVVGVALGLLIFNIWFERKQVARTQDRLGPNRVGPWGVFQTIADVLKLLTKEVIFPANADPAVYWMAPILAAGSVIMIWAVMPFSPVKIGTDLNVGVLYVVAIGSLGTIGVLTAGWGSNNKYALLGGLRMVAQVVSYEVPLVLSLLVPVMLAGTMSMQGLVVEQGGMWFLLMSPVAALIFLISSQAEVGRAPFDLTEGESEIVAGYHIEYSGTAFAMFYLGEWMHAFVVSALFATLFLGGWQGPGATEVPVLGLIYFLVKSYFVYFVLNWLRFTVPRIRIDQLLSLNWKFLVPVALINLVMTAIVDRIVTTAIAVDPNASAFIQTLPRAGVLFLANVALMGVILIVLREVARRERARVEALVDEGVFSAPAVEAAPVEG